MLKLLLLCLILFSCKPSPQNEEKAFSPLALKGKSVYQANCTVCHNPNPLKNGSLGPDVAGSSLELLEARLIKGTYPDGYKPKRESRVMVPMPQLQADLPALEAYLREVYK
jgi:mono/diheme cytochrome c family protein